MHPKETVSTVADIHFAEETARALASAAGSARLYPVGSPMTVAAVERFVEAVAHCASARGPVRFVVDPKGLRLGDRPVAEGHAAVATLAETLYGHQAGQLIIGPDVSPAETIAFIQTIEDDPLNVRVGGGLRAALAARGVTNMGVVELSLRTSDEEGIAGLDLTLAPPERIAPALAEAAETWRVTATAGDGRDELGESIGRLEHATRTLAEERVAAAMLMLSERERVSVLDAALSSDRSGRKMDGALSVVVRLSPAALARLLAIYADGSNERLAGALQALSIPPEAVQALQTLLSTPPEPPGMLGTADGLDPAHLAAEALAEEPGDAVARWRLLNSATPGDSASRALDATLAVMKRRPDRDSITSVSVALSAALKAGAWRSAYRGAAALEELANVHPELAGSIARARASLDDPPALAAAAAASAVDTPGAGDLIALGGRPAADAIVATYAATADAAARARLAAVGARLGDALAASAAHTVKDADSATAIATVDLLARARTRGCASATARALDHVDPTVRTTALQALSACPEPDAVRLQVRAMDHWDPATRRVAARELGRPGIDTAVEPLVRILWKRELFERNYELRKQCIASLVAIGSPWALPGLRRMAGWRFVMDRRGRELRFLARKAVAELEAPASARPQGRMAS